MAKRKQYILRSLSLHLRKWVKKFKRLGVRNRIMLVSVVLGICTVMYAGYMSNKRTYINPATHGPLLNLIAKVESNGNYNAYFSNASNNEIDFTSMSIKQVLRWQADFVQQGNPSSAVGRYQIVNTTLSSLVKQLEIDTDQKFDMTMQDRMAVALLERRGVIEFVNNEITQEQFAASIAKEWAALPRVTGKNPNESYYASDGLNRSRVEASEVLKVIKKAYL